MVAVFNSKLLLLSVSLSFTLLLTILCENVISGYFYPVPGTPYEPTGKLDYKVEYVNGNIKISIINPSWPDAESNSYVYIPVKFNGQANINIDLGDGFVQTGRPSIYVDWVADRFERAAKGAIKWAKIATAVASIGTHDYVATVFLTANTRSDPDSIIQIYKGIMQTARGQLVDIFLDIIYSSYPQYNLPVNKNDPHWVLPPSSSLIIKIPARVVSGDHAFILKINEIGILDTGATNPLKELDALTRIPSEGINFEWHSFFASDSVPIYQLNDDGYCGFFEELEKQLWNFLNTMKQTLVFYLKWEGSKLSLKVIDPEGNIYLDTEISGNESSITIPDAMPGNWQIRVEAIDIPEEGESYELQIFGAPPSTSIPDFDLKKEFNGRAKKFRKKYALLSGFFDIYVEPTTGSGIKYIQIEDERVAKKFGRIPPMFKIMLYNGTQKFTLSKRSYTVSVENGKLKITIPFSDGIELPVKLNYREIFKEIRNRCFKPEIFRQRKIGECYRNAWKELTRKPKIYSLENGWKLEIKYYDWVFIRNVDSSATETIVTAIGTEGDTVRKAFELDVFS
jgi:hypothetical protein